MKFMRGQIMVYYTAMKHRKPMISRDLEEFCRYSDGNTPADGADAFGRLGVVKEETSEAGIPADSATRMKYFVAGLTASPGLTL